MKIKKEEKELNKKDEIKIKENEKNLKKKEMKKLKKIIYYIQYI